MIKLNGYPITPTIFPDKTSQVWKLPEEYFNPRVNTITWEFENEAEFMHVAQLKYLLDFTQDENSYKFLKLPYLPYGRQDKPVSNAATFALMPFFTLLNTLDFDGVDVFDPHNVELTSKCIDKVFIEMPYHDPLFKELDADPVYPDQGAANRYNAPAFALIFGKDRNPLTGEIKGIKVTSGKIEAKKYLIIDDICDGGRTFIEVAKKLYEAGATEVYLYVSHGIFSKGLQVLRDAGIKRIFTRNGEVK